MGRILKKQIIRTEVSRAGEDMNERETYPRHIGREISQSRGLMSGKGRKPLQPFD